MSANASNIQRARKRQEKRRRQTENARRLVTAAHMTPGRNEAGEKVDRHPSGVPNVQTDRRLESVKTLVKRARRLILRMGLAAARSAARKHQRKARRGRLAAIAEVARQECGRFNFLRAFGRWVAPDLISKFAVLLMAAMTMAFAGGCGLARYTRSSTSADGQVEQVQATVVKFGIDTTIERLEYQRSVDAATFKLGGYDSQAKVQLLQAIVESLPK